MYAARPFNKTGLGRDKSKSSFNIYEYPNYKLESFNQFKSLWVGSSKRGKVNRLVTLSMLFMVSFLFVLFKCWEVKNIQMLLLVMHKINWQLG